jgi:fermentation-respiration switch protein FrsA (DUF1100 family)
MLAVLLVVAACGRLPGGGPATAGGSGGSPPPDASGIGRYAVGLRQLTFTDPSRVTDPTPALPGDETQGRTLPTTVWYPASGSSGDGAATARGSFPVVLFSHGLLGQPGDYQALLSRWAGAGVVVVAPTYPLTNRHAARVTAGDVVNQPGDASFVLTSVLALAATPGDPFAGLLDGGHLGAAGHSTGAVTTVGLFTRCCRDARLGAGVVLAGNATGFRDGFSGPPAPLLFEHGDRDPLVPLATGRLTFDAVPWPKAFVTLRGQGHVDPYLKPESAAFRVVAATTAEFLRSSLAGDGAAAAALRPDATVTGVASIDDRL